MCRASQLPYDESQILAFERILDYIPVAEKMQVEIMNNNKLIRYMMEVIRSKNVLIKKRMADREKQHIKMNTSDIKIFQMYSSLIEKQSNMIHQEIKKLGVTCLIKQVQSLPFFEISILISSAMEKYIQEQEYIIKLLLNNLFYRESMLSVVN